MLLVVVVPVHVLRIMRVAVAGQGRCRTLLSLELVGLGQARDAALEGELGESRLLIQAIASLIAPLRVVQRVTAR